MVEEGTYAWLEIADSDLFTGVLPRNLCASVFANRELYLVLANYEKNAVSIATKDAYVQVAGSSVEPKKEWNIPERSFLILRHV